MPDDSRALVADLLRWLAESPRSYDAVMAAWRTSCPRLTIWEDAVDAGFVSVGYEAGSEGRTVSITKAGMAFLEDIGACG